MRNVDRGWQVTLNAATLAGSPVTTRVTTVTTTVLNTDGTSTTTTIQRPGTDGTTDGTTTVVNDDGTTTTTVIATTATTTTTAYTAMRILGGTTVLWTATVLAADSVPAPVVCGSESEIMVSADSAADRPESNGTVRFRVTGAVGQTVNFNVSQQGDYVIANNSGRGLGDHSAAISAGSDGRLRVGLDDDDVHEIDGSVTMTLLPGECYTIAPGGSSATITVIDNDPAPAGDGPAETTHGPYPTLTECLAGPPWGCFEHKAEWNGVEGFQDYTPGWWGWAD